MLVYCYDEGYRLTIEFQIHIIKKSFVDKAWILREIPIEKKIICSNQELRLIIF